MNWSANGSVVWAEASRGLMRAGGLFVVALAAVLSGLVDGEPLWADRTRVTCLVSVFTLPLLLGVTAIAAGQRMRQWSSVAATTPAGRHHPVVVAGWAGTVWAVLATGVQILAPLAVARPEDPVPWAALLPWLQTVASMIAGAWTGAVIGSVFRGRIAGPLIAGAVLLGLFAANYLPGRWRLIAPFDSPWYTPWIEPAPAVPGGHTLIAGAVIVLAHGLLHPGRLRTVIASTVAAFLVVGGAATIATVAEPARYQIRAMPDGPVCYDIGLGSTFCAHPLAGETGQNTASALSQVRAVIGIRWRVPHRLTHDAMPADPEVRVVPMSYQADPATDLDNAAFALSPTCSPTPAGQQARDDIYQYLQIRLELYSPAPDSPLADLTSLAPEDLDRWISTQIRAGGCDA